MSNFILFKGFNWEYETFGNGNEPLLAFHGFGNHASDFKVLEPSLGKKFKIISFNLPFHGKSVHDLSSKEVSYSNDDVKELFEKFLAENSIKTFSLMGYSLGGKIALQLIELFPDRINTVILFAPDGIRNNWENGFVTNTSLGKRLYQRIINDPSSLFKVAKLLKALKIINPKLLDFVHNQLSTREKRQLVWDVWRCFRDIKPNIINIRRIVNKNRITIHLFFGKYDSIIPPSIGKKFASGLTDKNALHIIESGHNLIREKMNAELSRVL